MFGFGIKIVDLNRRFFPPNSLISKHQKFSTLRQVGRAKIKTLLHFGEIPAIPVFKRENSPS